MSGIKDQVVSVAEELTDAQRRVVLWPDPAKCFAMNIQNRTALVRKALMEPVPGTRRSGRLTEFGMQVRTYLQAQGFVSPDLLPGDRNPPTPAPAAPSYQPSGDFSIGGLLWPGISKLTEEMGEVSDLLPELVFVKSIGRTQQVAGKLIGNEGRLNHWDGTNLRDRLQEELGDLQAAIDFVVETNDLDRLFITRRRIEKTQKFDQWHREQIATRKADR